LGATSCPSRPVLCIAPAALPGPVDIDRFFSSDE